MIQVPDAASIATMRLVRERTRRSVGGSTGTNVWGALLLVAQMLAEGQRGSVVTLICDGGERYAGTYYDDAWVADQGMELGPYEEALETFLEQGAFADVAVWVLHLGDHAVDLLHDLGRDLVHPVRVTRVGLDLGEEPVSSSLRVTHSHPRTTSPHLNCFIREAPDPDEWRISSASTNAECAGS